MRKINPSRALFCSLVTILALLHIAQASPLSPAAAASPINNNNSITIGSSISVNGTSTSYWLSPSGIFAFGFYPSAYGQYQVSIWINKGSLSCGGGGDGGRTVIWTADLYLDDKQDDGLGSEPSILFNQQGVFVLQRPGINKSQPLFLHAPPAAAASYALMQDSGNFVVYDSNSNVLWQSFDYPTDTIISGQTLKSGHNLLSKSYKLKICGIKGNLVIEDTSSDAVDDDKIFGIIPIGFSKCKPVALNLDLSGHLYLVDPNGLVVNGLVVKNLTKGEDHDIADYNSHVKHTIYRATLGSDGVFRLYGERIWSQCGETVELWHSKCSICHAKMAFSVVLSFGIVVTFILAMSILTTIYTWRQRQSFPWVDLVFGFVTTGLLIATFCIYLFQIKPYY